MPLFSEKEVLRLKLSTIPSDLLKQIAKQKGKKISGVSEIIKYLSDSDITQGYVDDLIKNNYSELVKERQKIICDEDLLKELFKVQEFNWGVVQGQLDNKIQVNYVRKYFRYSDIIKHVEQELYDEIKKYVICTWYNHWTTVIIEDLISRHERIIPTIKNVKGVDIFFDNQPFDLKITYMPNSYKNIQESLKNPKDLIIWLYENQGAQRFGADNRFFVILYDKQNPKKSWEIKRDINLIQTKISEFFNTEKVNKSDEIVFTFQKRTYTAISKILFIIK